MNQRIKEFANQSQKYAIEWLDETGEVHNYYDVYFEKFAELIVQECMNVLDPGEHQLIARFQARKWLAEHFGVEE